MTFDSSLVRRLVRLAIDEDFSRGDITADLALPKGIAARSEIIAREKMTICGLELIPIIFQEIGWECGIKALVRDGADVKPNTSLMVLDAEARHVLSVERTILNFLQRLSGVATLTREYCKKSKGIVLLDTRKTMPGFRLLDKYAVRVGGATNHRMDLSDLILIKNNHIDANGGSVRVTLKRVYAGKPPYVPVEVEVRTIAELQEAITFNPEIIMLDNFRDTEIRKALKIVSAAGVKSLIEVSGGVRLERLGKLRQLGIGFASCGALTTQARMVDISMRTKLRGKK